jgi:hypothetical protein
MKAASAMLRCLVEETAAFCDDEVHEAVIAVPGDFDMRQEDLVRQAGQQAGLRILGIVRAPAALAMGLASSETGSNECDAHIVVEMDATTAYVSLVILDQSTMDARPMPRVVEHRHNAQIGRNHWIQAVADVVAGEAKSQNAPGVCDVAPGGVLWEQCARALPLFNRMDTVSVVCGADLAHVEVSRSAFEERTRRLASELRTLVAQVMDEGCQRQRIDKKRITPVLVGPVTEMPLLTGVVRAAVGREPQRASEVERLVATGAAILAYAHRDVVAAVASTAAERPRETAPAEIEAPAMPQPLPPEPWRGMVLKYRLAYRRKAWWLTWDVEAPIPDFAGFVLVAQQNGVPAAPEDGIELHRWAPAGTVAVGMQESVLTSELLMHEGWGGFFCKLFIVDPSQEKHVLIMHPNTCVRHNLTGARPARKRPRAFAMRRAPSHFVCTGECCCKKYPVEEMLFGSHTDLTIRPRRGEWPWYSGIQRSLLRKALIPVPIDARTGQRLNRKLCPKGHELPGTAGLQASLIVELAGRGEAGKSHYVAALVDHLHDRISPDFNGAMVFADDHTAHRYEHEYRKPLLEQHRQIPPTPPHHASRLVYDLTVGGRGEPGEDRCAVNLVIDDIGGHCDSGQTAQEHPAAASATIFLIDPLQIDAVRAEMPTELLPGKDSETEPQSILSRMLDVLPHGMLCADKRISMPFAVVLTKCDILRDHGFIPANRLWNTGFHHRGVYDRAAHEDMQGMWEELLMKWDPALCRLLAADFENYAFFGVSSTGCSVDPRTGMYPFIAPWRVEDPLLWILAELGVIPVRGGAP